MGKPKMSKHRKSVARAGVQNSFFVLIQIDSLSNRVDEQHVHRVRYSASTVPSANALDIWRGDCGQSAALPEDVDVALFRRRPHRSYGQMDSVAEQGPVVATFRYGDTSGRASGKALSHSCSGCSDG